eukprot:6194768-Pleurochrysis_carterae.AAC.3
MQVGGTKRDDAWTSRDTAAYPPDLNFLFARVIASLRVPTHAAAGAKAASSDSAPPDSSPSEPVAPPLPRDQPDTTPPASQPADEDDATQRRPHREHFRRGLGAYPLRHTDDRSVAPVLLTRRTDAPRTYGRGARCAFMVSPASDPKTRKQALAEDREGWTTAERAEIANHKANGSWTMIDRSEVPSGRALVRLIWVYKRKRSGTLKA